MNRLLSALFAMAVLAAPVAAADLPTVIVYPFTVSTALDPAANTRVVTLLSDAIAQGNHVRLIQADAAVERAGYLSAARRLGAQFYITGFLSPLGNGATIIEQVVSTQSGIVVFSNSGQLESVADAVGQGDILRNAVLHESAGRGYGGFAPTGGTAPRAATPPPDRAAAAGTPAPGANVGALFRRKKPQAAPSPSPSPSPAP